jgi:hypothetical protein
MAVESRVGLREAPTRLPAANRAMPLERGKSCQQLIVIGIVDGCLRDVSI